MAKPDDESRFCWFQKACFLHCRPCSLHHPSPFYHIYSIKQIFIQSWILQSIQQTLIHNPPQAWHVDSKLPKQLWPFVPQIRLTSDRPSQRVVNRSRGFLRHFQGMWGQQLFHNTKALFVIQKADGPKTLGKISRSYCGLSIKYQEVLTPCCVHSCHILWGQAFSLRTSLMKQ